jgi:serine/threonine-protein kinase
MSPEQCELHPSELDPRADIYALGVVLYELICGRLPYLVSHQNLAEATRIIREQPPDPPRSSNSDLDSDSKRSC